MSLPQIAGSQADLVVKQFIPALSVPLGDCCGQSPVCEVAGVGGSASYLVQTTIAQHLDLSRASTSQSHVGACPEVLSPRTAMGSWMLGPVMLGRDHPEPCLSSPTVRHSRARVPVKNRSPGRAAACAKELVPCSIRTLFHCLRGVAI